jgi:hypothetical protein
MSSKNWSLVRARDDLLTAFTTRRPAACDFGDMAARPAGLACSAAGLGHSVASNVIVVQESCRPARL